MASPMRIYPDSTFDQTTEALYHIPPQPRRSIGTDPFAQGIPPLPNERRSNYREVNCTDPGGCSCRIPTGDGNRRKRVTRRRTNRGSSISRKQKRTQEHGRQRTEGGCSRDSSSTRCCKPCKPCPPCGPNRNGRGVIIEEEYYEERVDIYFDRGVRCMPPPPPPPPPVVVCPPQVVVEPCPPPPIIIERCPPPLFAEPCPPPPVIVCPPPVIVEPCPPPAIAFMPPPVVIEVHPPIPICPPPVIIIEEGGFGCSG